MESGGIALPLGDGRLRPDLVPTGAEGAEVSDGVFEREFTRLSDTAFALMRAMDRFDFARGNRFNTYATWAIIRKLAGFDRRRRRRASRAVALYEVCPATRESESEQYEREEAQDVCRTTVERLLSRLDWRERRILEYRHGIGGGPAHTLGQIGRDLGISKERVRQLEQCAHAKLRSLAHLEAIGPSSL
jgi:RNA polymerase primary sigma factor